MKKIYYTMPLSSKKGPAKRNQLTTFIHFCDGGGGERRDIATCAIQLAREAKMDARSRINKAPGRRTFFLYIYVQIYIYLYIYFRLQFIFFSFYHACLPRSWARKRHLRESLDLKMWNWDSLNTAIKWISNW